MATHFDLEGRVVLVTGGGTGLGRQMTLALAAAGARVMICGRSAAPLHDTSQLAAAAGTPVDTMCVDITSPGDLDAMKVDHPKFDVLVNNAGTWARDDWQSATVEQLMQITAVNVGAPLRLTQMYLGGMREQQWGRIINITSLYASRAPNPRLYDPVPQNPCYTISKHGLLGLTRFLAALLAPDGITVNAISPGHFPVPTGPTHAQLSPRTWQALRDWTPAGRLGSDTDVAGMVVFLASSAAGFVTGQDIAIDGGWSVW